MKKNQKKVWNNLSKKFSKCFSTHPDQCLADLELEYILSNVKGKTLNVGCGIGHETFVCKNKTGDAEGIDFSEKMINIARKRYPNCKFTVGNVLKLPYPDNYFNTVTTRRTLINLLTKKEQKKAIDEIKRVTKHGGKIIFVEATKQGYSILNKYRKSFGLKKIKVVDFNLPMDEKILLGEFPNSDIFFLNTYYFLTRIYYPLVTKKVKYGTIFQKSAREIQRKINISIRCSPHIILITKITKKYSKFTR